MTGANDFSGLQLIEAIALAREEFRKLNRWLRSQVEVVEVMSGLDFRQLPSGVAIEFSSDAELRCGQAVSWWLELRRGTGEWIIESSINVNHELGHDRLHDLPTRYAVDAAEIASEIVGAAVTLTATREIVNFEIPWPGSRTDKT